MCSSLYRSAQCALDGDDAKGSMDVKVRTDVVFGHDVNFFG